MEQLLLSPGDVKDIGDDQAAPVDWAMMEEAVGKAVHRVPVIERARIAGGWAGLRPLTPDDHAILGWAPEVGGFFLAVGWGGHGFQHSPATGRFVAEWIVDGRPSMDLSLFDPARFDGRTPPLPAKGRAPGARTRSDTTPDPRPSEGACPMTLKIVVPDDFPAAFTGSSAEPRLRGLGDVAVHTERGADQEAELIRRIGEAEVVVNIRAHARFTDRVLAACPRLRLISIWGTGTDNVDLAACQARGVAVTNTPGVNAHAVAEHTLALMLAITRRIPAMDQGRGQVSGREDSSSSWRGAPWASLGSAPSASGSPSFWPRSASASWRRPTGPTRDAPPRPARATSRSICSSGNRTS